MPEDTQKFSLKDQLFNAGKVGYLADLFGATSNDFDARRFQADVMDRLLELELKQRIDWIAEVLAQHLPDDFDKSAGIILRALPAPCDPSLGDDDFGDFIFAPLGVYVANKCEDENLGLCLDLVEEITQRFSMEYAIRGLINQWPSSVMARLAHWAEHPHYHVRRLVSEGTRPKLPWGIKINIDANDALPLLDKLHADSTRFVTRSVANHLNDIAKTDEAIVTGQLQKWHAAQKQDAREMEWMTRHSLRTLVKKGNRDALAMLGYRRDAPVTAKIVAYNAQVAIGDLLNFEVEISAETDVPVLVDYVIWFQKKTGNQSPKVFKLKQGIVKTGQTLRMVKSYRLKKGSTTLPLFSGEHKLAVQVNGVVKDQVDFNLADG